MPGEALTLAEIFSGAACCAPRRRKSSRAHGNPFPVLSCVLFFKQVPNLCAEGPGKTMPDRGSQVHQTLPQIIVVLKSSNGMKLQCWTSQQWHPRANSRLLSRIPATVCSLAVPGQVGRSCGPRRIMRLDSSRAAPLLATVVQWPYGCPRAKGAASSAFRALLGSRPQRSPADR